MGRVPLAGTGGRAMLLDYWHALLPCASSNDDGIVVVDAMIHTDHVLTRPEALRILTVYFLPAGHAERPRRGYFLYS